MRPIARLALALCLTTATLPSFAQIMPPRILDAPAEARVGAVPEAAGTGATVQFYHGFFNGFPQSMADARDMLEGRSFVPIFDTYCGMVPYVDFTNATVADSLGRSGDPVLCFPYLQADLGDSAVPCTRQLGYPIGRYFRGGGAVMRVRGLLAVREAGVVTYAWGHDDGFAFNLGATPVFEYNDPTGSRVDRQAVRFAEPGLYLFQLDWYDGVEGALIDWYQADGDQTDARFTAQTFSLVPTRDLYPTDGLPCTLDCQACPTEAPRCDHARSRCVVCLRDADCSGANDQCRDGRCVPRSMPLDAGVTDGATADLGPDASLPRTDPPGCACRARRREEGPRGLAFGVISLAIGAIEQRRRRRSSVL